MRKTPQAAPKGPYARRRPTAAREAYCLYVERAAEGANEADGPFSAACKEDLHGDDSERQGKGLPRPAPGPRHIPDRKRVGCRLRAHSRRARLPGAGDLE